MDGRAALAELLAGPEPPRREALLLEFPALRELWKCGVCGVPWEEHSAAWCPHRHAYRPERNGGG